MPPTPCRHTSESADGDDPVRRVRARPVRLSAPAARARGRARSGAGLRQADPRGGRTLGRHLRRRPGSRLIVAPNHGPREAHGPAGSQYASATCGSACRQEAVPVRPHVSVLVVDDDAVVRAWVRLSLEGTEFFVGGEAATADDARSLVERRRPRVLLLDLHLGAKGSTTGVDLVRELRVGGEPAIAVVMTARPEPGLNEIAREAGAQGTVLKRGRAEDLLAVLRAVVNGDRRSTRITRAPGPATVVRRSRNESVRCSGSSPQGRPTARSQASSASARRPSRPCSRVLREARVCDGPRRWRPRTNAACCESRRRHRSRAQTDVRA